MEGFVRKADEGDARWFYGNLFVIKAGGPGTGGRFSLIDCTSPPGSEPGTHARQGEDDASYVLDGTLQGHAGTPDGPHRLETSCSSPATRRTTSP